MKTDQLKDKKILILGFQQEGMTTLKFLRQLFPQKVIGVADKLTAKELKLKAARETIRSDQNLRLHLGRNYLEAIKEYDVIFKAPGISPFLPQIQEAKIPILSETALFFDLCPGKIIGVTGTKGKGTTSTLVYDLLKAANKKVFLVGNIGVTRLELLPELDKNSSVVYELSSHQLLGLNKSPQIAILLNVFPEHLDYYQNFDQYVQAKANITRHQTAQDFFIFNEDDYLVKKIAQKTKAQIIPFSLKTKLAQGCFVENEAIVYRTDEKGEEIIPVKEVPLIGHFNLQNVMAAIIVAKLFSLPISKIKKAIKNFKPLEHRLEKVGIFQGITFYNDALSTIPQSAIEAIESFKGQVGSVILGGFERHQDFKDLAKTVWKNKIETVILFPTTGQRIWEEIKAAQPKNQPLPKHLFTKNTKEAVEFAYQNTGKGKICLLSPASPSFSVFQDYQERGRLFKKYARHEF